VIGCLVPAGLSLRPSWSIDFGDVSETKRLGVWPENDEKEAKYTKALE